MLTGSAGERSFIEPSVTLIHESSPFKKIELAGRTCYKSESKITKESSVRFVKNLIKHGHTAMLEHAVLVFELDLDRCAKAKDELKMYEQYLRSDPYIHVTSVDHPYRRVLVSANIRAILQRKLRDPLYVSLLTAYPDFYPEDADSYKDMLFPHIKMPIVDIRKIKDLTEEEFDAHFYLSARFITDRGVSHEMVRHRPCSFAQESTRYCNYSKDQFGGHLAFVRPSTYDNWTMDQQAAFCNALAIIDKTYTMLTTDEHALQAQQARAILPNTLKTEIIITSNAGEWKHFYNLRSKGVTGKPHPDIKFVADIARKKMNKYIRSLKYDNYFAF